MDDYMPQLIRIMPGYGGEYVFDEDGDVTRLTLVFEEHPNIERITKIEWGLLKVADWIEHCEFLGEKIPWEKIDTSGLQLAQEMAITLGDIGIPIVYQLRDKERTQIHISNTGELNPAILPSSHFYVNR